MTHNVTLPLRSCLHTTLGERGAREGESEREAGRMRMGRGGEVGGRVGQGGG